MLLTIRKLYIFLTLMVVVIFAILGQDKASHLLNGDNYYLQFNNMQALDEYKKALAYDEEDFHILYRLIRAYNDTGEDIDSDESEVYFQQALDYANLMVTLYPDSAQSYCYLALSYGNMALFKGGQEKVTYAMMVEKNALRAMQMDPTDFAPYLILGIYYKEVTNMNWFQRTFAETFFGFIPKGTEDDSLGMLHKAIDIRPDFISTYYHIGSIFEEKGDLPEAVKYYEKVIELDFSDHCDHFKKEIAISKLSELTSQLSN